jgi:hypothetical protein
MYQRSLMDCKSLERRYFRSKIVIVNNQVINVETVFIYEEPTFLCLIFFSSFELINIINAFSLHRY